MEKGSEFHLRLIICPTAERGGGERGREISTLVSVEGYHLNECRKMVRKREKNGEPLVANRQTRTKMYAGDELLPIILKLKSQSQMSFCQYRAQATADGVGSARSSGLHRGASAHSSRWDIVCTDPQLHVSSVV
ncbi:hypothetical protein NQZ68_032404 [Dissostichus eleginoides]|nr:hypothetical protein NQZ68_032404 [Dissostichus eleginoides]